MSNEVKPKELPKRFQEVWDAKESYVVEKFGTRGAVAVKILVMEFFIHGNCMQSKL